MKNFTNNFKQFTSRLSARWLIMALMLLVGTSSAWAASSFASGDVIYVDVSACSWYENDECGPGIQLNKTGNYIKMDKVADKLYTYTFTQSVTSFNLGRVAATGTTKHNNFEGTFTNYDPSSKNVFKVNDNSTGGSWGSPSFLKVYFDNSNTNWTNIYMCYGHGSYSKMNVKVNNQACGNIYYAIITDNWTNETQIAFHNSTQAETSWGSENGSITHRYGWLDGDVTHTYDISLDDANGKVFKPSKSTSKLTTGNNGKQIDAHLWGGDDAYAEETFSDNMCCTAPASAPSLSKVSDIVKCGTTTITSGTLEIGTVNTGSTYYYKKGTDGTEQEISLNNNQFTVSSTGDYYVKEVNDCGASSSWSTTKVTISESNNQVSISDISGSETICADVTGQEYSITEIPDVSYAWSVTGEGLSTNSSTTNTVLISAEDKTSQVNGILSVSVTKNGCETTIQQPKSITLIPLPTISTDSPTEGTVCSETTIGQLEKTLTITKSANSSTKWYKGVEEKSSTATVETGEYTIKAISNTGSCVSNSSVTYNVTGITNIPTALAIDINGQASASICEGTATINAKASGATSYSLYKGNGDLVETINGDANGVSFTVSEANTYKVKATNNCGSTGYSSDVILTVIDVPSKPSFVTDGEVTCAGQPVNPNLSKELASGEYLVWYNASEGGTNLGSNLTSSTKDGANTYYAAVSNGTCESAERTPYTVDVEADPIEGLTLTLVDGYGNSLPLNYTYCQGDDVNVKLTYNGGIYWGEPEWNSTLTAGDMNTSGLRYDALNKKGEGTYTISNLQASGTLQVALTMCGDTKATSNVLNVNITPQAETPTVEVLLNIEKCGNDITQYGKIQISPYNAGYTYKINETDITPNNNGIVENLSTAGRFTLFAINSCKVSTPSAPFTISETDNKPTISSITISNSSPVINEDVLLTVEGSDIARVEWSITSGNNASLSDASGNSVKLTSTASGAVTVTATAISSNGCRATSTKEVTFSAAENCDPITDNTKIEIWCQVTGTTTPYCHAYNIKSPDNVGFAEWPGLTHTSKSGDYYIWTLDNTNGLDISNNKVGIVFSKNSSGNNQTADITTFYVGNRYYFTYNANSNDKNTNYTKGNSEPLTTYPPLSAPAVNTVSVTSEQGSGVVNFVGRVIKTGCATGSAIWVGYQYKKANEEWPITGVTAGSGEKQLVSIGNNPGSEDFTVNVEGLEDGDYHFRAYVINGYGRSADANNYDQGVYYGLDKLVTVSTVQTAVKTATITLTDEKGNEVDKNKKYCVGETGYIKVTSDVKYTTIKWKTDKGTEIEETGNNGVYPFVAKGDDNIWVMLSNKHNDIDRPAINENPLVINTFADPILPRVSLNKVSICSNDAVGATVKLTNVVKGQTYQLYQQIDKGDGTITEKAIGEAKTQTEEVTDKTELVLHTLNNTYTTGKYFVKTYTSDCNANIVATQPFTFTVVDAAEVFISIDPVSAETTPWMPAKFTVNASDKYTLNVTKGIPAEPATEVEVNQNGNKVSVKIPLPEGSTLPEGTTGVYGQYENVVFPQGATTQYTITATLSAAGGDNPCAAPTSATINLVPYVEECTKGH